MFGMYGFTTKHDDEASSLLRLYCGYYLLEHDEYDMTLHNFTTLEETS